MSTTYSCADSGALPDAVTEAARVLSQGECIVMPTDTVYGIGCDAFSPLGVQALLGAKGRTREMPPPVLIPDPAVLDGLADAISQDARDLAGAFWPGALTLVCWAQPTLGWDLGETHGTVALRVPDDPVALAVLQAVGPLAVSSANLTGMPAARSADQAQQMLGDRVAVYLDGGPRPVSDEAPDSVPSTIVDCTGDRPRVLRQGAIDLAQLREVAPTVLGEHEQGSSSVTRTDVGHGHDTADSPGEGHGGEPVGEQAASDVAGITTVERIGSSSHFAARPSPRAGAATQAMPGPDATDQEVARALVGHHAATAPRGRVDQNRRRGSTPRPTETEALSMEDALELVRGPGLPEE